MINWICEYWVPLLFVLAVVVGFSCCLVGMSHEEDQFMTECHHDHKHYECQAMWANANRPGAVVMPMPVVVSQ